MEEQDKDLCMLRLVGIAYNHQSSEIFALILQEVDGDRRLPIMIGTAEAQSIECKLQEIITPRPLTHDLMATIIRAFGIILQKVVLKRLESGVYAADLYFSQGGEEIIIDSRSSDAVALAIRLAVPIYTTRALLEEAGIRKQEMQQSKKEKPTVNLNEKDSLSAFSKEELEEKLTKAVDLEQYEEAARIKRELDSRK